MRIVAQNLSVLAGSGFRLVGVDDEVVRPPWIDELRHERPLEAGRETRAAAPAQSRGLHLGDDPVAPLVDDRLGVVPIAPRPPALQSPAAHPLTSGENPILAF